MPLPFLKYLYRFAASLKARGQGVAPEVMRQRGELELHSAGTKVSGELSLRGLFVVSWERGWGRRLGAGMGTSETANRLRQSAT